MAQAPLQVIAFKTPPEPAKGRPTDRRWRATLESALKSRPGVWALVAENTYPSKGREYKDDAKYELRRVYRGSNRCDLYMRYIGDSSLTHTRGTNGQLR